ncbi:PVC-type heme-binding CxxCH protein [Paludisphaera rhizosphaerae]|uniref:PVC-type heme-binding CxxCH protein n=1 Tax=Paludisphaera rhizosphaerae TaxID=2711216 RepID=UPI0013EA5864|nr:PVC-type heme-binding CxxCH protein [Paludisphaera rhizosphaerae]
MEIHRHFEKRRRPGASRASTSSAAAVVATIWALAISASVGLAKDGRLPDPRLELAKGAHVSVIGNTLPDRMQHTGWLEAVMHSRFPDHELTVRNLAFSGDELTIRLRSAAFGTPDEWLTKNRTDVVCAFFGYNESYGGLAQFRTDLDEFIKHTLAQKYNGESAPKLVLFSPIAFEDLHDPSLPDGKDVNLRLERLTAVMSDLAETRNIRFIDLFHPTQKLYAKAEKPLTINGIHLTSEGDKAVAEIVERALFGDNKVQDPVQFAKLHKAVLDKSDVWFNRYRTVDGYSIYGGRADLAFVEKQTNRVVAQREMEVLDVMTANRDKQIWAIAQGGDPGPVDDSNTPPFIPVVTNKPGAGPDGAHIYQGGEEAISKMTPGKSLKVNLFASEETFPDLAKPVQMTFDAKGRLWVACWPTYPHWKPKSPRNDKIIILEDTDGDGKADKQTTFADDLHCPTGFEIIPQGVLVAQAPDIMLLKDTNGDDKADERVRVLSGVDSADTHHTSNSFRVGPGGDVYFQEGTFHHSQIETPFGPPIRNANAGVYRYEPRSQKIDVYVTYPFANPHGHVFDRWGQDFVTDGTGNVNYYATAFSGHLEFPDKHRPVKPYFQQRTRPCAGTEILSSKHFPEDWQGDLLVCNVIGFQGIHRYKYQDAGSGFTAVEQEPLVFSSDTNFRPSDVETGPDGAIYFLDWHNPLIGHMQHNLRDPSRDATHGRIYRVTYEGRPLSEKAVIAGRSIEEQLELLKSPEDRVRYRVKAALCATDPAKVLPALASWLNKLDPNDPALEHHVLEALWVHQTYDLVNLDLLRRCLTATDPRARAAAVRVLCCWRDRVPDVIDVLRKLARDENPRVRLEVVRAASFFEEPDALDVALSTTELPSDYYLDYTRGETLRALEPVVKKALREGREIEFRSEAAARYFLDRAAAEDLIQMKRTAPVLREILFRSGVREDDRRKALAELSASLGFTPAKVLAEQLSARDAEGAAAIDDAVAMELARMLGERDRAELTAVRPLAETLATSAKSPIVRRIGLATLVAADGSADPAWTLSLRSAAGLRDFLAAAPLIRDPIVRSGLYSKIEPLLHDLPANLAGPKGGKGTVGRYVRVALPRRGTLTLAEVEVMSDGRNIALGCKASQKNTANDGVASRAVDGQTSGLYSMSSQTHTQENTDSPWWEVDLGDEYPIEAIVIHNRRDGNLGRRLQGYELSILDGSRQVVDRRADLPAPETKARQDYAGDGPAGVVRRAAMDALTTLRGHEAETFRALAKFVRDGVDRPAAILAIQKLPATTWPSDELPTLADALLKNVAAIPVADRRTPAALDALQLGDMIAANLPADRSKAVRKALGELGVRAIRIGTVLEQMRYDVDRIVVQAGRPVEFVFENVDVMPHNFVVTQAGSLEEVGQLAEATGLQPDAMKRQYVPPSNKILLASKLLQPREVERIAFTAPTTPGVLPYVCTYPGHWRRMYGALYVVEDLDEYLASPEGYLAAHPLPIADEMLKSTRPRTEWTFDDLKASIAQLDPAASGDVGRSYQNGRQLFQLASCASCHQVGGVGAVFGPDLAKLDPKQTPADLLKNVLDPSANINDKYAGYALELSSGQVANGLIVEETADAIKLVENPLASVVPRVIPKAEVEARAKSKVSIMPKGLLDKLTREEILDLIAYVAAAGDPNHPLFRSAHAGHGHGHGPAHPPAAAASGSGH